MKLQLRKQLSPVFVLLLVGVLGLLAVGVALGRTPRQARSPLPTGLTGNEPPLYFEKTPDPLN